MVQQIVTIPEYITRIKLSDHRRPTYYVNGTKIPREYSTSRYEFRDKKFRNYTKSLLYDTVEKIFIVKNKSFVGKPRYTSIGGNMLYAGMNEHVRMLIISGIKEYFRQYIQKLTPIKDFPIHIDAQLHAIPGLRNWDIDNLWIYIKCFQDLLIESRIIPDDSVKYITKAPSFEYFPVAENKDRKIIFILRPDTRSITHHVMFANEPTALLRLKGQYKSLDSVIYLVITDLKSGEVVIKYDGLHHRVSIGVGKKNLLYSKFFDSLTTIRYWAIQYNAVVIIDNNMATEYPNYDRDKLDAIIMRQLCEQGINVIIHNL